MDDREAPSTDTTLLARLSQTPSNESAWDEFVDRYGRMIYQWCRRRGLQEADAEDVTQNVLLALARQMREFVYDPSKSFRGWLKTIARRTWARFLADRQRRESGATSVDLDRICTDEARDDFLGRLEAEGEAELLELAGKAVRLRVDPRTWEAFRLLTEEGISGAETAHLLNMNAAAAYVARGRVLRMIQAEVRRLDGGPTP